MELVRAGIITQITYEKKQETDCKKSIDDICFLARAFNLVSIKVIFPIAGSKLEEILPCIGTDGKPKKEEVFRKEVETCYRHRGYEL